MKFLLYALITFISMIEPANANETFEFPLKTPRQIYEIIRANRSSLVYGIVNKNEKNECLIEFGLSEQSLVVRVNRSIGFFSTNNGQRSVDYEIAWAGFKEVFFKDVKNASVADTFFSTTTFTGIGEDHKTELGIILDAPKGSSVIKLGLFLQPLQEVNIGSAISPEKKQIPSGELKQIICGTYKIDVLK